MFYSHIQIQNYKGFTSICISFPGFYDTNIITALLYSSMYLIVSITTQIFNYFSCFQSHSKFSEVPEGSNYCAHPNFLQSRFLFIVFFPYKLIGINTFSLLLTCLQIICLSYIFQKAYLFAACPHLCSLSQGLCLLLFAPLMSFCRVSGRKDRLPFTCLHNATLISKTNQTQNSMYYTQQSRFRLETETRLITGTGKT